MKPMETTDAVEMPYPGLRSFSRDETHIFFGREDAISDLVDRMATHRFLAVTGYSGSGKSSLVRVGLLDALDRGLLVEAGSKWVVADFAPGNQPFMRLTSSLSRGLGREPDEHEARLIEAKLTRGPKGLVSWLDEIDVPGDTNILLLVDQFEEIFRYRQGRIGDDVSAFVQLLLASARQRDRPIYVVITMRSDFLGDCARFVGLAEQINDGQFLTPRLTRDQCREAIEGPAEVFDGRVEAELVTRILNDMAGNPDQLPLMQHILMLLWERARKRSSRDRLVLTLEDYVQLGGIGDAERDATKGAGRQGALSDHADLVLKSLSARQRELTCRIFRALTESQAGLRTVRRPASIQLISEIVDAPIPTLLPIIEAFRAPGRHFLTPATPTALLPETVIDITHESLIRQWGKLRDWVVDEYQAAETYRANERRAKLWKVRRGNALSTLDLAVAENWLSEDKPNAAWAQRYGDSFPLTLEFLKTSVRRRRTRKATAATVFVALPIAALLGMASVTAIVRAALIYDNPANEWSQSSVEPQITLLGDGSASPRAIPGGRLIGTAELERAIESGALNGSKFLLLDVYPRGDTTTVVYIPGSKYLGFAGKTGTFDDDVQKRLKAELTELTQGDQNVPLVYFCSGATCPYSYNASLRSLHLGYKHVYWYRGGILAWQAVQHTPPIDLSKLPPLNPQSVVTNGYSIATSLLNALVPTVDADVAVGRQYHERQQYDHAIDTFARLIKREPSRAEGYLGRARAQVAKFETAEAYKDFTHVIDKLADKLVMPDTLDKVLIERGDLLLRGSQPDTAMNDYRAAERLSAPNDTLRKKIAAAHVLRAEIVLRGNAPTRYADAIKDYDAAIALVANNADYLAKRADALARQGGASAAKAVQDYDAAIRIAPKSAEAYQMRAKYYEGRGEFARTIADFDVALTHKPGDKRMLRDRGLARFYHGDFEQAAIDLGRLINTDSEDVYTMLLRYIARARAQAGGMADIELAADMARVSTNWPKPVMEMMLGKRSTEATLKAASKPDEICEAHFYVGQKLMLAGRKAEALQHLAKAASPDICKTGFWEHIAAKAELARGGG